MYCFKIKHTPLPPGKTNCKYSTYKGGYNVGSIYRSISLGTVPETGIGRVTYPLTSSGIMSQCHVMAQNARL